MKMVIARMGRAAVSGFGLALVVAALGGSAVATRRSHAGDRSGLDGQRLTLLIGGAFMLMGKARKR